jgi:cysteine-rich repeat protein
MIRNNIPFCSCPSGYQAGLSMLRCAPIGENREIGFETTCDNMPTPGAFVAESKALTPTLFASCGVSSITSGTMMLAPQLAQPVLMPIAGITKDVALASPVSAAGEPVSIALAFLPAVNEVHFDVLDLDNPAGLSLVVHAGGVDLLPLTPAAPLGAKQVAFSQVSATPIERITLTYTPLANAMGDAFYVDALGFKVTGCGDKTVDKTAGETCDDGNSVQCDGCDNACVTSPVPCIEPT